MRPVTIAIPAYNRSDLLREALSSAVAQTFSDFEVLVSDNASSEDLKNVVASFDDDRLKLVRQPQSLGAAGNWRYVLETPRTPFVAWLHADDLWEPDHLQRAMDHFRHHDDAVLHSCAVGFFNKNGEQYVQRLRGHESDEEPTFFSSRKALLEWLYRLISQCSSNVFRREALSGLWWGPENLFYSLDFLLIGQVLCRGGWIYDPKQTAHFRVGTGASMASTSGEGKYCGVQSSLATRYVLRYALDRGILSEGDIVSGVEVWDDTRRGGLVVSLLSFEADPRLRRCAQEILRRYPTTLTGQEASRICKVASRTGKWVLPFGDLANRARVGWWPAKSREAH